MSESSQLLIVEDDPTMASLMADVASELGYGISLAETLDQAKRDWTPAGMAAYYGNEEAALLLLELGCARDDASLRRYAEEKGLAKVLSELDE